MQEELRPLITKLENHDLYAEINTVERLRFFMERHVYAVFDFMSLVKNIQRELAPANKFWTPPQEPAMARFINEIVLCEESDETPDGRFLSHFEIYCLAMAEIKANSDLPMAYVRNFTPQNIQNPDVPSEAMNFMKNTFSLIEKGEIHEIAAAFCFGREKSIPIMFQALLNKMDISQQQAPMFHYYLQRHIEVDGDSHGPLALKMIDHLCAGNEDKKSQALAAATDALKARIKFWDRIQEEIQTI